MPLIDHSAASIFFWSNHLHAVFFIGETNHYELAFPFKMALVVR